jgi:hypothetical protein
VLTETDSRFRADAVARIAIKPPNILFIPRAPASKRGARMPPVSPALGRIKTRQSLSSFVEITL